MDKVSFTADEEQLTVWRFNAALFGLLGLGFGGFIGLVTTAPGPGSIVALLLWAQNSVGSARL